MRHALVLSALLLAAAPILGQAAIYKWVDAHGVTHFTEQPPPSGKGEEVQPRVTRPATPPPAAPASAGDAAPPAGEADKAKPKEMFTMPAEQMAEQCKNARQRLQQLESSPRIMTRGEDGQMQRATEEERQRMMDDERKRIELYCVE